MTYDFTRYLNIRSAINPVMSPDGRRLAFLSDITGNWQAWCVDVAGGWPRQLTFFADKVWELHGTASANHLLAVGDAGGNENQQFFLIEFANSGAVATGMGHQVRRLTQRDDSIYRFGAWNQAGDQLVYTCNERNPIDFDLHWMDVVSGEQRRLKESSGNRTILAWSPDGRFVLSEDAVGPVELALFVLDVNTGEERCVTTGHPPALYHSWQWNEVGLFCISDRTYDRGALCQFDPQTGAVRQLLSAEELGNDGELEHFVLNQLGNRAVISSNVEGRSQLFLLGLEKAQGEIRIMQEWRALNGLPAGGVCNALAFTNQGADLVFNWQTATQPSDLWLLTIDQVNQPNSAPRQVTYSDNAGIDLAQLVAPRSIRYPSFDGHSIQALFFTPKTAPPSRGYPVILYVHGGPASQVRPELSASFQYFVEQGYTILAPNVRGSTGSGRQFTLLDEVELRMDSVTDLKYAVDWLQQQPQIDAGRIAIFGRSYGGFMVLAALTTYPTLFAAGVDVVGIANWVTFLEKTAPWRRGHREREYGSLQNHRQFLQEISPIHKIANIRCPVHIQAGDNDPRVPLYESAQLAEQLGAQGSEVEFVHYADEGHMFSKLPNRIDSFERIAAFLQKHLLT